MLAFLGSLLSSLLKMDLPLLGVAKAKKGPIKLI
jgi:hypothetical protein